MADDTTHTTPGDAPDVIKTGEDGSLPNNLGSRRAWVWMQDTPEGGGGRFDVLATRVRVWLNKGAKVVPSYPIHYGPSGRRGKPLHQFAESQPGGEAFIPRGGTAAGSQKPDGSTPDDQPTDQATGEPATADTTTTKPKGGRTQ
ncbi:hypothetical protein AB0J14_04710 [Micromonospora arborensis]|uniref:hypothetical protein n=1 Tax=Micromonospora arborensis TaxID=2116518 RepID=UPI0033EF4879